MLTNPRTLAPAYDVLREFLHALLDLLLALPRHLYAFARRDARLRRFESLERVHLSPLPEQLAAPGLELKSMILSCGDASGEIHAARLLKVLQERHPHLQVSGYGGQQLADMGMDVWLPLADLNVMGFKDVAAQLPMFFGAVHRFSKAIHKQHPDVVVLLDYPGLNMHLLRIAKRHGIPVVHYVAPQLWAWAPWRVHDFRRADRLLTILPFENDWYERHGASTTFVGHPLADSLAADSSVWQPPSSEEGVEWIAILPGSRKREIRENLSLMLEAAELLQQQRPQVCFVLPHLRDKVWPQIEEMLTASSVKVTKVRGEFHSVLRQCHGAWVVSGTASLEVAALGIPSVVVYAMSSKLGAWLAAHALTVPFVGGINLVAGRQLAPERIGLNLKATDLCADLLAQLKEPGRSAIVEQLQAVHDTALAPGTAKRAALAVEDAVINRTKS
ncbi:MAG: lipid-A-disaccharide synthase [Planctomycetes bacterium]|nr:lipid-A-disaccharide synthase [Planctomycetota bacterium]MCP4771743.1 lipid-A-disaccharide synthase [Planctomycetota bacterium]MCP4861014.1 lipid-A-disaccharide synthase [Planctomycetota bacterium]